MRKNTGELKKDLLSRVKNLWGKSTTEYLKKIGGKQIKRTKDIIKSIKESYILKIKNIKHMPHIKNKFLQLIILKNGKLELMMGHNIDELNGSANRKSVYFTANTNIPSITLVKIHLNNNDLRFTIRGFKLFHTQITLDLTKEEQETLHKIIEKSKTEKFKTKKTLKKALKKRRNTKRRNTKRRNTKR